MFYSDCFLMDRPSDIIFVRGCFAEEFSPEIGSFLSRARRLLRAAPLFQLHLHALQLELYSVFRCFQKIKLQIHQHEIGSWRGILFFFFFIECNVGSREVRWNFLTLHDV